MRCPVTFPRRRRLPCAPSLSLAGALLLWFGVVAAAGAAVPTAATGGTTRAVTARDAPVASHGAIQLGRPLALSGGPDGHGYRFRDSEGDPAIAGFSDIAAAGTPVVLGDNDSSPIVFPFPFSYYGANRNGTILHVSSNGFVSFGAGGLTDPGNAGIPGLADPNDAVYAFWDDLDPTNALALAGIDSAIYWQVLGAAPGRRLIVQWNQVPFSPGTGGTADDGAVTFQVQLWEDGDIVFAYRAPTGCAATDCDRGAGGSASIGIESATALPGGQAGLPYSFGTPSLQRKAGGYLESILFTAPLVGGLAAGRLGAAAPAAARGRNVPTPFPAGAIAVQAALAVVATVVLGAALRGWGSARAAR
jgi:hypothetical protein